MCGSMNPGATSICEASMCSAPGGSRIVAAGPASAIELPSMINRPGANLSSGVNKMPASITVNAFLFTTGSQVADNPPEIALCVAQAFLGLFSGASDRAHDDRNLEVRSGAFGQASGFIGLHTQNLLEDMHSALAEFIVGHADVDHPIAVSHAQPDHRRCADHVENELLRGSGFHSRRTGNHLRPDESQYREIGRLRHRTVFDANHCNRPGTFAFRKFERSKRVRCGS